jgi:hypothetical protein
LIKDIPGLIEEFEDIEENEPEIISQFINTVDELKIQFIKRFPTIIEEYEQSLPVVITHLALINDSIESSGLIKAVVRSLTFGGISIVLVW